MQSKSTTDKKIFLTAHWRHLVMINYEVDPKILIPHLPPYIELDTYNGKTLVSVVGFMFMDTRVFGVKWPMHTHFEEVNLRLYVKYFTGMEWRRGVVFVSEIVPRPVIATMANLLYHEHYSSMPMKHSHSVSDEAIALSYQWKNKHRWNAIEVIADTPLIDIQPGSEEEFIFEHYWGYNQYNKTTTIEYGVEHQAWQTHQVKSWKLDCDVAGLYGSEFVPFLSRQPSSVFLAKGSDVVIRTPRFIRKAVAKT